MDSLIMPNSILIDHLVTTFKSLMNSTSPKSTCRPHQTMLLAVVKPVACPASTDNPLELVGLDPDDFIHPLITPQLKALTSQLHCPETHHMSPPPARVTDDCQELSNIILHTLVYV